VAFDIAEINSVSATLGADQLAAGLIAGGLGLLFVILYLMLYYRALGLVAVVSLVVASYLTYVSFVLLGRTVGFTLTLAGVAGAIVAIGITADSFIVYFERIRDEVRDNKSLRVAAEYGWLRARRTILAADFVSLLAAGVLYFVSVGNVRGFAFVLGLTTIIDIAVVFFFTRPLIAVLVNRSFFARGGRFSGVDPVRLGVAPANVENAKIAANTTSEES
jgi:preprotein translocase subunit SecD